MATKDVACFPLASKRWSLEKWARLLREGCAANGCERCHSYGKFALARILLCKGVVRCAGLKVSGDEGVYEAFTIFSRVMDLIGWVRLEYKCQVGVETNF